MMLREWKLPNLNASTFPYTDALRGKPKGLHSKKIAYGISDSHFVSSSYSLSPFLDLKAKTRGAIFVFDATADRQLKGTGKEKLG